MEGGHKLIGSYRMLLLLGALIARGLFSREMGAKKITKIVKGLNDTGPCAVLFRVLALDNICGLVAA